MKTLTDIVSDAAKRFDSRPLYRASAEARLELLAWIPDEDAGDVDSAEMIAWAFADAPETEMPHGVCCLFETSPAQWATDSWIEDEDPGDADPAEPLLRRAVLEISFADLRGRSLLPSYPHDGSPF